MAVDLFLFLIQLQYNTTVVQHNSSTTQHNLLSNLIFVSNIYRTVILWKGHLNVLLFLIHIIFSIYVWYSMWYTDLYVFPFNSPGFGQSVPSRLGGLRHQPLQCHPHACDIIIIFCASSSCSSLKRQMEQENDMDNCPKPLYLNILYAVILMQCFRQTCQYDIYHH